MPFVLPKRMNILDNSLNECDLCFKVARLLNLCIFTRYFSFRFFNLFEYFRVRFSSRLFGSACIHLSIMTDLFLYFQIWFFRFSQKYLSFGFYLVNSECGAYQPVEHCLVYSYHLLRIHSSLILRIIPSSRKALRNRKFISRFYFRLFCLLLNLGSYIIGILESLFR